MKFTDKLKDATERTGSIVCVGMDPRVERIPLEGDVEEVITSFYSRMLDAFEENDCIPGAVKPNIAFYAQYGFPGLRALKKVISKAKDMDIPVILDAKRADIGKTSAAYAKSVFDEWGADAVTVAPYMGSDSVEPFLERGAIYVLNRTSNDGAKDFQDLKVDGEALFMKVSEKIIKWWSDGMGAVVGATYPDELGMIAEKFASSGKDVPLLIPGVGAQGGSASEVVSQLKNAGYDLDLARINSSSGINYAWEDYDGPWEEACVKAVKELENDIDYRNR